MLSHAAAMSFRWPQTLLLLGGLLLAGASCQKNDPPPPLKPAASGQPYLDHAQPKLQTVKLWLGAQELITEVASTRTEISTGMMHRQQMADR